MTSALVNNFRVFAITVIGKRTEHLLREYLRESQNGSERRAKFVARIGQETRPRLCGIQGLPPIRTGCDQLLVLILKLSPKFSPNNLERHCFAAGR